MIRISYNNSDIGYPHELILSSAIKAEEILNNPLYNEKTKIFALMLLNLIEKTTNYSLSLNQLDKEFKLYTRLAFQRKGLSSDKKSYQKEIVFLLEEFNVRATKPLAREIDAILERMLFLSIYINPETPMKLINKKILVYLAELPENSEAYIIGYIIKYLKQNTIRNDDVGKLIAKIKQNLPSEISIYLTYVFAQKYKNYKSNFLYEHYRILRDFMGENELIFENKKLDDLVLESIFKNSIVLYICGYSKSLRLSYQETLNYLKSNISDETIVNRFEIAFNKSFMVRIKNIIKFNPLYLFGLAIVFLIVDVFWRIKLPPVINIFGIFEFQLNFYLPLFAILALSILIFLFLKLYKLKERIKENLLGGIQKNDAK